LPRIGLADPHRVESCHVSVCQEILHLYLPGVDDVDDIINGDAESCLKLTPLLGDC